MVMSLFFQPFAEVRLLKVNGAPAKALLDVMGTVADIGERVVKGKHLAHVPDIMSCFS